MAPRETWSNAPTASTERMVARGHASVAARSNRLTASVPVRVLRPYWCGMHASWNCGAKCLASTRPTSRRKASPTTIGPFHWAFGERPGGRPEDPRAQQEGVPHGQAEGRRRAATGHPPHCRGECGDARWWRRRVQQRSRVGQHANRQGKPARVEGSAPRARTGVRPLAVVHRGRVVAFQGREARRGCRACRVRGVQP